MTDRKARAAIKQLARSVGCDVSFPDYFKEHSFYESDYASVRGLSKRLESAEMLIRVLIKELGYKVQEPGTVGYRLTKQKGGTK